MALCTNTDLSKQNRTPVTWQSAERSIWQVIKCVGGGPLNKDVHGVVQRCSFLPFSPSVWGAEQGKCYN